MDAYSLLLYLPVRLIVHPLSSGFHDDPWHSPQKADRSAKGLRSLADHRKNVTTTSTKRACHNRRRWSPCTSAEYLKGLLQQGQRPGCLKQLCDRVDQIGQLQVQKIPSAQGYPHMFAQARPKPLALLRSGTCLRNPKPQASWRHHGRGRYRRACVGSPVDLQRLRRTFVVTQTRLQCCNMCFARQHNCGSVFMLHPLPLLQLVQLLLLLLLVQPQRRQQQQQQQK